MSNNNLPATHRDFADQIRGRIRKQLHKLGDTESEVAAVLLANECYGYRLKCRTCPVAMWLAKTLGYGLDVMVLDSYVRVTAAGMPYSVCVDLPQPVRDFLGSFDYLGWYEQLDAVKLTARNDGWDDASWAASWAGLGLEPGGADRG